MQKMQNAGLIREVEALKENLKDNMEKQEEAMNKRIPPLTQGQILRRLQKESTIEKEV